MYQPVTNPEPLMTRRMLRAGAWRAEPLRVIDGGARWGAETHWDVYGDQLELLAFEPDEEECTRIMSAVGRGPDEIRFTCEPLALARSTGRATLNVARFPDSSSVLPNNEAFVRRFAMASYLEQVGSATVQTTSVDAFLESRGLEYADFMKLDVEGAELDVLEGAEHALSRSLLGLSVEVWFHEEHTGRPLFGDIDAYLRDLGFVLFDLRQLNRWRRSCLAGESYDSWIGSGQLMYGNALYLRDLPARLEAGDGLGLPSGAVLKLASLAELFCYPDFAVEVIESAQRAGLLVAGEAEPLIADLRRQAMGATGNGWRQATRRAVRAAIPPATRRRLVRLVQGLIAE
jgi:FkbM family methyltransferase